MEIDDIYAVRLQRFRTLMDDRFGGKQAAIATAVGKPANYVSRIISGNKKLGEEIVREFETSLDLPAYWFDGLTDIAAWPFPSVSRAAYESLTPEQRRGIEQWVARQVEAFGDTHTPGAGNTKKSA